MVVLVIVVVVVVVAVVAAATAFAVDKVPLFWFVVGDCSGR